MAAALLELASWLLSSSAAWCDQGRFNAYAKTFPSRVAAPPLTSSRFLTFDRLSLDRFALDGQGRVLNCRGDPYAVLHRLRACLGRNCARVPGVRERIAIGLPLARIQRHPKGAASVGQADFINDVGCTQPEPKRRTARSQREAMSAV